MKKLVFATAAFAFCGFVLAQTASAPPVKMGLWETTSVTKIQLNLPPEVLQQLQGKNLPGMGPTTVKTQTCMTAESWRDSLTKAQQQQKNQDCQVTNLKQDSSSMSADIVCTGKASAKGHMQFTFQSPEKWQGTMHMEMSDGKNPQPTIMDTTMESVFKGADCQGIAPGQGKLVR
ncbi:MAG: DUF3617 domain-containing protein [Acidobacteriaceae bacterium]|nr:DUF3617 domain-containing protein [Acidobacteriaceae bacterium]